MLAHHFKKADLNKHNYGFEWIITPSLSTLTKWLVQSNTSFFDPQNIRYQSEDSSMKDIMFEISSIHEYKKKGLCVEENIKIANMFSRRLDRLKHTLEHSSHLILLRFQHQKVNHNEDILNLLRTLRANYPHLKVYFYLIYHQNNKPSEDLLNEINYICYQPTLRYRLKNRIKRQINPENYELDLWKGDVLAFRKIFKVIDRQLKNQINLKTH